MLYVEAKSKAQQQDTDMTPIGNEFDVYLSALGFMPVDDAAAPQHGLPGTTSPTNAQGSGRFATAAMQNQTSQLGDWFSGNRYMMGLLEEDLSQFHPNGPWNSGV